MKGDLIIIDDNLLEGFGENVSLTEFKADSLVEKINEDFSIVDGLIIDCAEAEKVGRDNLAYMRKVRKNIDDVKKAVKKVEMADYNKFEKEVKRMLEAIDNKIEPLAEKVDANDQKRIDTLHDELEAYWSEIAKTENLLVPVDQVLFMEWKNKNKKKDDIKGQMDLTAGEVKFIDKMIDDIKNPIEKAAAIIKASDIINGEGFTYGMKDTIVDFVKNLQKMESTLKNNEPDEEINIEFKNAPATPVELTEDDKKVETFQFEITGQRHELKKVFAIMNECSSISKKLLSN